MSRPVKSSAEAVKSVHVLPVFVVSVVEFRSGVADICRQFIISVNRVFRAVGFHKFVEPNNVAYLLGYYRNGNVQCIEFIVFTDEYGKRIVSVNQRGCSEFRIDIQRIYVVSEIISVAGNRINRRVAEFFKINRVFFSADENFLRFF